MTFREWWKGWVKDRPNWNRGHEQAAWNAALEEAAKVADLESDCGDDRHGNAVSAAIRKLKETP